MMIQSVCTKNVLQSWSRRSATAKQGTTTTVRFLGSRGSRGHGWYVKYRAGEGDRHLQGEYHDRDTPEQCQQWNNSILALGSTRIYMDVVVEPKRGAEVNSIPGIYTVPSLHSLTAPPQRLEFDVASAVMPETCHNFATLVENKEYTGTILYRFEKNVGLCGGDILTNTGKTGRSHLSNRLSVNVQADPLVMWHLPGTVSMLVASVEEIDSRFFFCTAASPHVDGIHRAFGQLTPESLATVQEWQKTILTRGGGIPATYDMIIAEAGILSENKQDSLPKESSPVQVASASA